jgi:MFS transporter, FLVCR family, disrupted in renal carcinoma protein 2
MRATVLVTGCGALVAATGIRLVAMGGGGSGVWALYAGQYLNGMVGCVALAAPAKLSQLWFPASERASATAVSTLANNLGAAAGFVLLPWQVDTWGWRSTLVQYAVAAALLAIATLAYFPDAPPVPPTRSAAMGEESFRAGLQQLRSNTAFWGLIVAAGLPNGLWAGLSSVISILLAPAPWSYSTSADTSSLLTSSAWLGTWATLAGVVGGMVIAPLADRSKAYRPLLLGMTFLALAGFALFATTLAGYNGGGNAVVFATLIAGNAALAASLPLFVEVACEVAYPVSPSTVDGIIQWVYNLGAAVFQVIGLASNVLNSHPTALVWAMPAALVVAAAVLVVVRPEHKRLAVDVGAAAAGGRKARLADAPHNGGGGWGAWWRGGAHDGARRGAYDDAADGAPLLSV